MYKKGIVKQKAIKEIRDPDELIKISKKMEMSKKNGRQSKNTESRGK
jgi:hypothetical protein